ncbi:XRE family transcriptional regulator [Aurantimonas sp. 22II-16-19i]|nr:XRE family transcriptional regulator [Aurantimonas sp. 22II-16-19i]
MRRTDMSRVSDFDHLIALRIRQRRVLIGMSQTGLARAVGVTFQQIQKYESGKNRVSVGRLQQIAVALGLPVSDFFDAASWPKSFGGSLESFVTTREGVELTTAFMHLASRQIRYRIIRLIVAITDSQAEAPSSAHAADRYQKSKPESL